MDADAGREDGLRPLAPAELEGLLRQIEPAARLVPPRLLRRVVRRDAGLGGFGFRAPQAKSYVIERQPLLEIADRQELGFGPHEPLPDTILLLERPGFEELAAAPGRDILLHVWRRLFHARIQLALRQRIAAGRLTADQLGQRIGRLGGVVFEEIRSVLRQERFLLPPYDDAGVYVEFAAVYLEFRRFVPTLLCSYFPAIERPEEVDRLLAEDVDADDIFLATWLPGAPDPAGAGGERDGKRGQAPFAGTARRVLRTNGACPLFPISSAEHTVGQANRGTLQFTGGRASDLGPDETPVTASPSASKYVGWMARAERAAAVGNLAGAAVRRARALVRAPHDRTALAAAALRNDIHRLVARLQNALELSEQDCGAWQETLLALAHQAPRGLWTVEARLLYDLQKVCVDHERAIYAVDPIEWLLWLGRRPLKRPLGSQREVLMAKHLATAQGRLAAVCIADRLRRQLSGLLRAAREQAEARLRRHFGPRIAQIIDQVGLQPQNLPERVAKQKLVQELLDRITERGLLTLGDLRDALSRNHLKQPDCGGLRDFLRGDALLRADRRLAVALDGVYHRGEIYLLAIQRFSLAAFGTRWGRWLTLNLAIPFGGAYVILAAVDHFVHLITGLEPALAPTLLEPGSYAPNLLLGLFLLGLIRGPGFRRWVWRAVRAAGRAARFLLIDCVGRLLELPWLQRILHSRWTRLALAWLVKPALPTLIYWRLLPPPSALRQGSGALAMVFLASALILNSRLGRNLEELLVDRVVEGWHRFGVRFFSGLFWFVVDLFRLLLETIERLLYGVDEWLRFRAGQGRAVLVAKAALGTAWFFVAYTVRFCVNLLLEPQFNPIKHVPVVTVSHKCIAPLSKVVFEALLAHGLRRTAATATTFVIIFGTPGIFGFLVWELKENWRLFAANRPSGLGPAPIGQHGETMPRLVRPGFHSGTIPKRLARLRRAERQALAGGDWRRVRKHRDALGRVELALRRYAQRELVELLAESRRWEGPPPVVGEIRLATNRVRIALRLAGPAEGRLWIAFEIESGWLLGDVASGDVGGDRSHPCEAPAGPLRGTWDLSASSRQALRLALTGLCKTAGVELLRAQLADEDGTRNGRVLPERPSELALSGQEGLPLPPGMQHVFAQVPIPWADWVAAWEEDSM